MSYEIATDLIRIAPRHWCTHWTNLLSTQHNKLIDFKDKTLTTCFFTEECLALQCSRSPTQSRLCKWHIGQSNVALLGPGLVKMHTQISYYKETQVINHSNVGVACDVPAIGSNRWGINGGLLGHEDMWALNRSKATWGWVINEEHNLYTHKIVCYMTTWRLQCLQVTIVLSISISSFLCFLHLFHWIFALQTGHVSDVLAILSLRHSVQNLQTMETAKTGTNGLIQDITNGDRASWPAA